MLDYRYDENGDTIIKKEFGEYRIHANKKIKKVELYHRIYRGGTDKLYGEERLVGSFIHTATCLLAIGKDQYELIYTDGKDYKEYKKHEIRITQERREAIEKEQEPFLEFYREIKKNKEIK